MAKAKKLKANKSRREGFKLRAFKAQGNPPKWPPNKDSTETPTPPNP